jgi:hypothetical protein
MRLSEIALPLYKMNAKIKKHEYNRTDYFAYKANEDRESHP